MMKKNKTIMFGMIFVVAMLASIAIASATGIDSCGVINTGGNYVLTRDISFSGDCIKINQLVPGNIILDCDNHKLTNTGSTGTAIDISRSDVTVRKCRIEAIGPSQGSVGIIIEKDKRGVIIENNEITINGRVGGYWDFAIVVAGYWNTIRNNKIHANGYTDDGIKVGTSGEGNSVTGNIIYVNYPTTHSGEAIRIEGYRNYIGGNTINTRGSQGYGILLYGPKALGNQIELNTIKVMDEAGIALDSITDRQKYLPDNKIISNTITATSGSYGKATGIYIRNSLANYNIANNKITATGNRGIYLRESENMIITGNTIATTTESLSGMEISYSNKNTIEGNIIATSGKWADGIGNWESYENKINSNTITASGEGSRGIMLAWHSGDSEIKNNKVIASSTGIYLHDDNNNNLIEGNTVKGNGGIHISQSHDVDVLNNIVDGGIVLQYFGTDNNLVDGNTVLSGNYGIYVFGDENGGPSMNTISNNDVTNSDRGIVLETDANNNILMRNTASYNIYGIFVGSVSGNTFRDNIACFNSKDFSDASVSKDTLISEQTCDISDPSGICNYQCAVRESHCCPAGDNRAVRGWYEVDCNSATAENLIVADDCSEDVECIVEAKLAKFSQELIVPENAKTKVNWIANFLPNSTNNTITDEDTIVNDSAQVFALAKTAATTDPDAAGSVASSPYASAYPSQSITEWRNAKSFLWFEPKFNGPYIAEWNPITQAKVYLSAWGIKAVKSGTGSEERIDANLNSVGSEPMLAGMPYFISPDSSGVVTWVGSVPQHATFHLKKGPLGWTSGANMITLPLDTSYKMASDLCNDAELFAAGIDTIGVWSVEEQDYINPKTGQKGAPIKCSAVQNPARNFNIYPGQVYEIVVSENTEWEQK